MTNKYSPKSITPEFAAALLEIVFEDRAKARDSEFALNKTHIFKGKPIDYTRSEDFPLISDITREQPLYTPESYDSMRVIDAPLNVTPNVTNQKAEKVSLLNTLRVYRDSFKGAIGDIVRII